MVNIYNKYILPKLINGLMQSDEITKEREVIIPAAKGIVIEIGGGSGTNIPFYNNNIEKLFIVEPSKELLKLAEEKIKSSPFPIEVLMGGAETIPLRDNSVDTVVSTWTLCSIPDVRGALKEVRRVLKPGGKFIFIEHGYSPDPSVARWQVRLTPIWKHIAGGCHLDRKIDELIKEAGLTISDLQVVYRKGLCTAGYFYKGQALK